jgi:hypothetical protein
MIKGLCVPTNPAISPLRFAPDYRDFFGRAHEHLSYGIDPIVNADCFRPRIYHCPSFEQEITGGVAGQSGVAAGGTVVFELGLPAGSLILGFLRTNTPVPNPNTATAPPVASGWRIQITDVARNFKFFEQPVPEAYFLNDAPSSDPNGPFAGNNLYVLLPSIRLLSAPYPVAPPGQFKVEFYNLLASVNKLVSLDVFVVEPDMENA